MLLHTCTSDTATCTLQAHPSMCPLNSYLISCRATYKIPDCVLSSLSSRAVPVCMRPSTPAALRVIRHCPMPGHIHQPLCISYSHYESTAVLMSVTFRNGLFCAQNGCGDA